LLCADALAVNVSVSAHTMMRVRYGFMR
jgi:hypothetical protein